MNDRVLVSVMVALTASACSMSHSVEDGSVATDARACVATFEMCRRHDDCCAGDYCSGPYGPSVCTPSSPDGSFCVAPRECASGTCVENVCGGVVPSCLPAGTACSDAAEEGCCEGTRCRPSGAITVCLPPGPDGDSCADASDCATGVCTDGMCRAESCVAIGGLCGSGTHEECCSGLCDFGFSYGPGLCRAPQPAGASCYDGRWCTSSDCGEDGLCR